MRKLFKNTIRSRFFILLMTISITALVGVAGILLFTQSVKSDYLEQREVLTDKGNVLRDMERNVTQMVVHMRGYAAFGNDNELVKSEQFKHKLESEIVAYKQLGLSEQENILVDEMEIFVDKYWNDLLPLMKPFIQTNNYESLKEASKYTSSTIIVSNLLDEIAEGTDDIEQQLSNSHESFLETVDNMNYLLILFLAIIFLVLSLASRNLTKLIVTPMSDLSKASQRLAKGEPISIDRLNRTDELGTLSNSFADMASQIKNREDHLSEQNKQLTLQAEQLVNTKRTLERFNQMNHALSITQNEQELLDQVIGDLAVIYRFDLGILFTIENGTFATVGIDREKYRNDVDTYFSTAIHRLQQNGQAFVTKRQVEQGEAGYYFEEKSYDLHAPVINANNDLIAVLVCTRVANPFSLSEQEEIKGILNRVSLSLEKINYFVQTENSRQLNQDIIDNINEGIQFIDEEGYLVQYNQKWLEFFYLYNGEMETDLHLEQRCSWLEKVAVHVKSRDAFIAYIEKVIRTEGQGGTNYQFEVKNGTSNVLTVYAEAVYRQEKRIGTLFVYRDITAEYEVDQMKSNLVSTVSHELRTPLASVLGYTELMISKELKPERQERYLKTIHKEALRLTNLINDFLDLQRMESGYQEYKMENVNMVELAEDVLDRFRINNPDHTLRVIDHSNFSSVQADPQSIVQLYTNLISNAIKFSPNGGDVVISFNNSNNHLYIHVSDKGIGIPDNELKRLFTKFHRIDNSSQRKIGGTGLGLAICKEIVEAHNGKIAVRSELDKGSVFTVTLPLDPTISRSTVKVENQLLPEIVLIEDDTSLSQLLEDELKDSGFYVRKYANGEDVLRHLEHLSPDGIVVDLMLGDGIDGWEIIKAVKNHHHLEEIPIFISSALEQKEKGEKLGVDHYLTKPYPPNKLSTVILQTMLQYEKRGQILYANEDEDINNNPPS
ncbi:ATP-binding protein [Aquibacillus koreensis]|uniref:histidine kinase n=1 Tax=Aquibacillus koreensis TaxID=279446 RepID=A0A9X3WK40_9BACI|nr:ATP-binding protein [Aquibacillus koreensis]MCT2535625.1 ATP-binding protein [Aquibacillus koreensis]MDC3420090.1 ATP-binding protein [Aquibacillus koreensis]